MSSSCLAPSPSALDRRPRGLIVQGLFIGSGRSRSCPRDCTPIHPFVYPLALRQALRLPGQRPPDTILIYATSCETELVPIRVTSHWDRSRGIYATPRTEQGPQGSWLMPQSMQSPLSRLSSALGYQRFTHGTSMPNNWHKSTAAACRFTPRTADQSSKALPCDPQTKQW